MTAPASDLERFRQALDQQRGLLLEANRSSRYQPPTDLASAELNLLGDGVASEPIAA